METEVVRFRGISISRRKWRKYIPDLRIGDHGIDVKGWLGFLDDLRQIMLDVRILRGNEELLIELEHLGNQGIFSLAEYPPRVRH